MMAGEKQVHVYVISSGEESPPNPRLKLCLKHQQWPHLLLNRHETDNHHPEAIVISDNSSSDVEVVSVRIKVPVHTCKEGNPRGQHVQHLPSSSHGNFSTSFPLTTSSPFQSAAPTHHTCGLQQGLVPRDSSTPNAKVAPVAAVLPRPRSSQLDHHITTPTRERHFAKKRGSRESRNRRSWLLQQYQRTSSTDSEVDYESSPATKTRHQRPRSRRRQRDQKENHRQTSEVSHGSSPGKQCRRVGTESANRMYLDNVTEPINTLIQENSLSKMPVRTEMLTNLHISNDIIAGDLPKDNARDPAIDGNLKCNSPIITDSACKRRPERSHSVYSSSLSDSDTDNELNFVSNNQDASEEDSHQDTSSPEEVVVYQDISRRALQENALVRNGSHHRISSPHRSPLQVTQDQARVCSPRSPAFQRRIRERDSELAFIPPKRQKTGAAFRRLDLKESIKAHKPLKQHDIEPTVIVNSSSDSECLPASKWQLSPKKEKIKLDASKYKFDIIKKNSVISESRSAFSSFNRSNSTPEVLISQPSEVIKRQSATEQHRRSENDHRTSFSTNRSAFEFIQRVKDSLSTSESSDSGKLHNDTNGTVNSTVSKLRHIGHNGCNFVSHSSTGNEGIKPEKKASDVKNELYLAGIPVHIKAPEMCNKSDTAKDLKEEGHSSELPSNILTFGILIQTLLEGCQEEEHHNEAVDFVQSFTNNRRCPSTDCLEYILKDILMKVESDALLVNSYSTLKHIQHLHLPSRDTFVFAWKTIKTVLAVLLADGASQTSVEFIKLQGNMLVLKYFTSVCAEDLEMQIKQGSVNKSYIHHLLSADTCISNVRDVISWICSCVEKIKQEEDCLHCDNVPHGHDTTLPQTRPKRPLCSTMLKKKACSPQDQSQARLTNLLIVLQLLQQLLHMCLVVSPNLLQSAEKMADEFLYYYWRLPNYYHKRKVLQTITCHLLRRKLIELILENCYKIEHDALDQSSLLLSISKVVKYYFKCVPSRNHVGIYGEYEEDNDKDRDVSADCEELVMLLLCLMQSYVWTTNGKIPETERNLRNRSPNESRQSSNHTANQLRPYNGKFSLSMNDKEYLLTMGDFVNELQTRLETYCPVLTMQTKLYLRQLDCMRDLALSECD